MKSWRGQTAPMRDMYIVYIFTLRPLYLKGKKIPFSIVW